MSKGLWGLYGGEKLFFCQIEFHSSKYRRTEASDSKDTSFFYRPMYYQIGSLECAI